MSNVENLCDHMALSCECGSVKFSLLRSGKIECSFCLRHVDGRWSLSVDGPLERLSRIQKARGAVLLAFFDDKVECGDESSRHASIKVIDGNTVDAAKQAISMAEEGCIGDE